MRADKTKERIIERNRYNPSDPKKAIRLTANGRTLKRRGDIIINERGSIAVEKKGYY